MTAARLRAAIAKAMPAAPVIADRAIVALTTEVLETAARALVVPKDDPAPADRRAVVLKVAVPKVAARAAVRPVVRRCVARAAMMTTTMTVRLVRAARNSAGPASDRAGLAECPASAARRSSAGCPVDLDEARKALAGCPDLPARRRVGGPLVVRPALADAQEARTTASPR